jgi:CubicO group peptidase (beta-lactamase class C family)
MEGEGVNAIPETFMQNTLRKRNLNRSYQMNKLSLSAVMPLMIASLFLSGFSSSSSSTTYTGTIAEGRSAAMEIMQKTGASSISLAFIDGEKVVWAEAFGLADKESMTAPQADTMYCIGSTSKMLATIAVMKLVDQGLVSLDAPLTTYIKSFSMASPEYTQITVRMLLNHSAGFPGADYRNSETSSPLPFSFSAQVLQTLKTQRLKHFPGYMSVYANDGFTIIEQLVSEVTGKSYAQFVQDQIFTPLDMNHSRYPLDYFPAGSFAKRYDGNTPQPQLCLNSFGSGGLYSTPTDMAKIATMLIGGGKLGNVRILSADSIAAMGVDQTLTNFNPVKANSYSYGLGWDTVCQPGLGAVGVTGWQKGGAVTLYGSVLTVAPAEGLAVVVMGASNGFGPDSATVIAERILLMALAERGRIAAMPSPLNLSPRPLKTPSSWQLDAASGYYANNDTFMRVQKQSDNCLNLDKYDLSINGWKNWIPGLKLRDDDRFSSDDRPSLSFSFKTAAGQQYLIIRYVTGYGHYQDDIIQGQQVTVTGIPAPWDTRLSTKWLVTNDHPDSGIWDYPLMQLKAVDNRLFADRGALQLVNPLFSASRAGMALLIPQMYGRDLDDVVIETRGAGEEWLRFGSYLYRPQETMSAVSDGNNAVNIGAEGLAEWRAIDTAGVTKTVTITPVAADGSWKAYDSDLQQIDAGEGEKSLTLSGGKYYLLFHDTANVYVRACPNRWQRDRPFDRFAALEPIKQGITEHFGGYEG